VINAEGGNLRRITTETSDDVVPSWSRDGRWIYFASYRSGGDEQVWKVPAEGGEAVQITKKGGFAAFESPDSKFVYYTKFDSSGLWRVPVEGGEEIMVLNQPKAGYWGYWAVADDGIYFVDPDAKPQAAIEFFSFATSRVTQVGALDKSPYKWVAGLAVSPDGRWILYSQIDQIDNNIVLVENFN
jgi:dipeptidyl aminopeptidase/acylaminoacyl peptidase